MSKIQKIIERSQKLTDNQKIALALGLSIFVVIAVVIILSLISRLFIPS